LRIADRLNSRAGRDRRDNARNRIRGPQSALTDFLASHNISAQQITSDYQRRVQEAAQAAAATSEEDKENEPEVDENGEDAADRKKRKRKEEMAIMKIKQSKEFKRRKAESAREEDEDEDDLARSMMQKSKPLPGQRETCELCNKAFTVTPYTVTGPDGGLLCASCGKEYKKDDKKSKAKEVKKTAPKGRRRQTESDRMMGDVKPGAKSLLESCVRRVADVVNDIDDFGDMPQSVLDRLSQILSKRRVITPRTLELFLRPDIDRIAIYDCAKLDEVDFIKIFREMPDLESVNLRFAGQFKDMSLRYMITTCKKVKHLQLGGSNLITNEAWIELCESLGPQLESLKISELNDSLDDATLEAMAQTCTNLRRLKLRSCSHLTGDGLVNLATLSSLEHLSLATGQDASASVLKTLVDNLGPNLRTLSLEGFSEADDEVVELINARCSNLTKLRFTGSNTCSDAAFTDLFANWANPPLTFIDMSDNRDIDSTAPDGPQDLPVGLGSNAFKALMKHSGSTLTKMNMHSCRHISAAALAEVFDGKTQYPLLKEIDFSFVASVDDVVLTGMFRSCPSLSKLAVFACFNAREVVVPRGVAVIGLPNAQDNIVVEGDGMEL
jgi:DNA repair protein RAD7